MKDKLCICNPYDISSKGDTYTGRKYKEFPPYDLHQQEPMEYEVWICHVCGGEYKKS